MKKLYELWSKLPEKFRDYAVSSLNTFVSTFLLVVALQFGGDTPPQYTWASLGALLMVAFRAAVRATSKDLVPALQKRLKK